MSRNSSGTGRIRRGRRRLVGAGVIVLVLLLFVGYTTHRFIQTRSMQLTGELVSRVETDDRLVALTFDDGPTDADAEAVLDVLAERDVPATFYVNGKDVEANSSTMRRLVEDGHEIGNHTWSHRPMVFVSPRTVADEIESTDAAIRGAGYEGPITFRPPYGKKFVALPLYLAEHDRLTVTWDVAYEDWTGAPQTSADLVEDTVAHTSPGTIILLHPWSGRTTTQAAIGPIIDQLQGQGYRFVTVGELVG